MDFSLFRFMVENIVFFTIRSAQTTVFSVVLTTKGHSKGKNYQSQWLRWQVQCIVANKYNSIYSMDIFFNYNNNCARNLEFIQVTTHKWGNSQMKDARSSHMTEYIVIKLEGTGWIAIQTTRPTFRINNFAYFQDWTVRIFLTLQSKAHYLSLQSSPDSRLYISNSV